MDRPFDLWMMLSMGASNSSFRKNSGLISRVINRLRWPLFWAVVLFACAPSAVKRGALAPEEREDYIQNYGEGANWKVRKAFVEGKLVPGMTKDLVVFLVGNPNRTAAETFGVSWGKSSESVIDQSDTQDSIWEYLDEKTGGVRFGLRFQSDTLRHIQGDAGQ
jgi:hypothetical protein